MNDFFKPEDFQIKVRNNEGRELIYPMCVADICGKLNKLIDEAPTVYGREYTHGDFKWSNVKHEHDITKAKLMFINEIKKEPCKHEPGPFAGQKMSVDRYDNRFYKYETNCQYCGVTLKATWNEV